MPTTSVRRARSEKWRPSAFWILAALVLPPLWFVVRYRIIDREKLPMHGAFVIAPNHYTEIDPVIVAAAVWKLGRAPRFLTKASLFSVPVVGWLLAKSGQIPVERASRSRTGAPLQAAERLVEHGQCVVIYPEGSLTRDPELWPMRGKTGAARMALEHDIPVIPVAHWGSQQVMARYSKKISFFPRKTVTIVFGDPVDLSEFRGKPLNAGTFAAATNAIMQDVTGLLEGVRGEKAPAERWNPTEHDQKETGRFEG
ncbi:MAG TPA: lysophospholipid acyltransferase family protein [Microbacteriaceae bacterium]